MKNGNLFGGGKITSAVYKALSSYLLVPIIFVFGFLCWAFSLNELCVCALTAIFVLIFLFCKDVKNSLPIVLYLPYFLSDLSERDAVWGVYFICIAAGVAAAVCFLIKNLILNGKTFNKGGLFYPTLVAAVALSLGGVAGRFNALGFFAILGIIVAILIFYLIALNYTENLLKYLSFVFVIGAIEILAELFTAYARAGDFWQSVNSRSVTFFSAEPVNTAAVIIALGIFGCFNFGYGKKYDVLAFLLAGLITAGVFLTRCRTVALLSAASLSAVFIAFIIFSKHKTLFIIFAVLAGAIAAAAILLKLDVKELWETFITKNGAGTNGRERLWPWCIEKFYEYPFFGYGFISDGDVPTVRNTITSLVLAHNTVLQWMTSTGVIGTALMGYFYCGKYTSLFKNFRREKLYAAASVIVVAASGMADQAASMDPFMFLLPFIIIAAAEAHGIKKRLY